MTYTFKTGCSAISQILFECYKFKEKLKSLNLH